MLLAAGAAVVTGCGDDDDGGGGSSEPTRLVVSAASSMTEALESCAPKFGDAENAEVRLSFAGSDELAAQIRQGAKVDVYAAANTSIPDELHADDLLEHAGGVRHERVRAGRSEGLRHRLRRGPDARTGPRW